MARTTGWKKQPSKQNVFILEEHSLSDIKNIHCSSRNSGWFSNSLWGRDVIPTISQRCKCAEPHTNSRHLSPGSLIAEPVHFTTVILTMPSYGHHSIITHDWTIITYLNYTVYYMLNYVCELSEGSAFQKQISKLSQSLESRLFAWKLPAPFCDKTTCHW